MSKAKDNFTRRIESLLNRGDVFIDGTRGTGFRLHLGEDFACSADTLPRLFAEAKKLSGAAVGLPRTTFEQRNGLVGGQRKRQSAAEVAEQAATDLEKFAADEPDRCRTRVERESIDLGDDFTQYRIGTPCRVVDPRGRCSGEYTIAERRRITRGRRAGMYELKLAPLQPKSKLMATKCFVNLGEKSKFLEPLAASAEDQRKAVVTMREKVRKNDEVKEARAERGRSAQENLQLEPGCRVLVRYRDFPREETVAKVNWKTGKVAIECSANRSGVRWFSPEAIIKKVSDAPAGYRPPVGQPKLTQRNLRKMMGLD